MTEIELRKIAKRMVDYLETLPDESEVSTAQLLNDAFNAKYVYDRKNLDYYYIIGDGSKIKEREMFELNRFLQKEANTRGYIIDELDFWGETVGLPYNIPAIFRNKEKLLSRLEACEKLKCYNDNYKEFTVKEIVTTGEKLSDKRVFQLITLPPELSTGRLDIRAMKTMAICIKGTGISRIFSIVQSDSRNEPQDSQSSIEEFTLDEQTNIDFWKETQWEHNIRHKWFEIANNGKDDLHVLFIREFSTWPKIED